MTEKNKICLCMIVKNESKIITRCLNAAKSIIDFVSICDTGSTDHTPDLIKDWCNENSIPGTVHHEPFKNFGYNRTVSVQLAQKTYPEADYLLLIDADMILRVESTFNKNSLQSDQYLTMQYNQSIKYWNTRLIKASLPWKSVGVTHEYWDIEGEKLHTKSNLDSLIVQDEEDGGFKHDKFERDKRLLLEGINNQETSPGLRTRYMFYLAQTLMALSQLEESIDWYKKRVQAGGWNEEVFYSLLQIGECYEKLASNYASKKEELLKVLQKENESIESPELIELRTEEETCLALANKYYLESWETRPTRAEPLYNLAKMYRSISKNNIALMYALKGKEIPFPKDDLLFVNYHVYDYLFDYEISICAFYTSSKDNKGRQAQKRLLKKRTQLPEYIKNTVEANAKFYKLT